jgi:hypothetical protein
MVQVCSLGNGSNHDQKKKNRWISEIV